MSVRTERARVPLLERGCPAGPLGRARLRRLLSIGERGPGGGATGKPLLLGGPRDPASASPAERRSWTRSATRSCSASRLQVGAPTTCSAPRPGKRGGERREEGRGGEERGGERQLTHAFQSLHSEPPEDRCRRRRVRCYRSAT